MRANSKFNDVFNVQFVAHQGSVLSPLLFIIALEALSQEFRIVSDDFVLLADTMHELLSELRERKKHVETKNLRVNMGNTKVTIIEENLH